VGETSKRIYEFCLAKPMLFGVAPLGHLGDQSLGVKHGPR